MAKTRLGGAKISFALSKFYGLLEPGPVVKCGKTSGRTVDK
jgi:hypothetical protein